MPLLGKAAMLLSFDIVAEAIEEHDDWHTHEHFPERLSIPGFLRGNRWVAQQGGPRYFVMYEVEDLAVLSSAAYLERLNHPTPWTTKMMTHYRGMKRGFCRIVRSFGGGTGQSALLTLFAAEEEKKAALRRWLIEEELPRLPAQAGLVSAHLFESALTPPATNEQRIRGGDSTMDQALLVSGYGATGVADLYRTRLGREHLEQRGASGIVGGIYRMDYTLANLEI